METKRLEQPMYIDRRQGDNHLPLDGEWEFTWAKEQSEAPWELSFAHLTKIPNSAYWSLFEAGVLPHPYIGCNSRQYDWVDKQVWYYRKRFFLPDRPKSLQAFLCVGGAAYYTRLWVNGSYAGDHQGMFGGPVARIESLLKYDAENEILLEIRACNYGGSLPAYAFQSPKNTAIVPWNVARDAHTSNGHFTVVGLWGDVRLVFLPAAHISRPYLTTTAVEGHTAKLHLKLELIQEELDELNPPRDYQSGTYDYTFAYRNGLADAFCDRGYMLRVVLKEKSSGAAAYEKTFDVPALDYGRIGISPEQYEGRFVNLDFSLPEPKLWQPVGLGEPHLYEVVLTLLQRGKALDCLTFDYGVRTFEMQPTAGEQFRSRWDDFLPVVNGKPFFLKGVNWMPIDFLYREDERMYRWILSLVKDAGIQLIRVWSGGGYPESDCFYKLCDELGILVWQDNFIANMDTPNWPQDVLQAQVCMNLYRLRNHASLVIHCGGNEFNAYSIGNAASMFVIQRNIQDLDPSRVFVRTTPDKGSAHIYRDMEPTWYRHCYRQLPFVGESGIHSFPNAKSFRQLISRGEFEKPADDMLLDSFRDSHPELLNHFTEYVPERVPRMLARASAITDISRANITDLAEATQMASAEFYQIMIESMRENYPVTGGMMLWVLKRAWTTVGIQLIDGLGDPIAPFYYVKNAYQPLHIQVSLPHLSFAPGEELSLPLKVVNESGKAYTGLKAWLEVYDTRLNKLFSRAYSVNIPSDDHLTSVAEETYRLPETREDGFFLVRSALFEGERLLSQSIYWPKCLQQLEKEADRAYYRLEPRENFVMKQGPWLKDSLQKAPAASLVCSWLGSGISAESGGHRFLITVRNTSSYPAFPVRLQVDDDQCVQHAADNYFFLPAGQEREIALYVLDKTEMKTTFRLQVSAWNAQAQDLLLTT